MSHQFLKLRRPGLHQAPPAVATSAGFDPATLALTGWWRASYSGSPWTPTTSAGSSGSNGNLSEGTNAPGTGTAVNGYTPADFDGTNDVLVTAADMDTLLSNGAGSILVLFYADAASADDPGWYAIPQLLGHNGAAGRVGMGFADAGVRAGYYDGVSHISVAASASTGAWHLAQMKYDSSNLKVRVDSGSWQTLAASAAVLTTATLRSGPNYTDAVWFDGRILEIMTIDSALSDADFDNIKSYVNDRYGLAL